MSEESYESVAWESEEAEYPESEEDIAEGEESAEDYRRRRRSRKAQHPGRGVQGMTINGNDGRPRNVRFPAKLATVAGTNQGLGSISDRVERLEARVRSQQKKDIATDGVVTLVIGGGLSAIGAFHASNKSTTSSSGLANWASEGVTKMAAVASVTQLTTSGAKLAFNGRYIRSGFGMAADIFSVLQLGLFAFGSLHRPSVIQEADTSKGNANLFTPGTLIYDANLGKEFVVIQTNNGSYFMAA